MEELKARSKILKGKFTRQHDRLRQALEEDQPQPLLESVCEEVCPLFSAADHVNDEIGLMSEEASIETEQINLELEQSKFEVQNLVIVRRQDCSKPKLSIKKV